MTEHAHSPLGPSAADRWINCPGSVNATRGIKDDSSEFAAEGNFAHDIAEMAREQDVPAADFIGHKATVDGFEFECTKEMAHHVQYFIDYVNQFGCDENLNEQRVRYDAWVIDGFGTLDAALLSDGVCRVIDLKYGKGIQVGAKDNSQLKLYALGLYQEYADFYEFDEFVLTIVQPRLDWIDEAVITLEELLDWADNVVEPAADETAKDTAAFNPGPWCTKNFCKIRATCRARSEQMREMLLDEVEDIRDPNEMTAEELGEAMGLVPFMRSWCNDVAAAVEKAVLAGQEIPDIDGIPYKMVAGRSRRAWRDQAAAEKAMRNYKVKVGDMWVRKFISPAQAEALASIGKKHPIIEKHVVTTQGAPTLVPGTDPRPDFRTSADEMDDIDDD